MPSLVRRSPMDFPQREETWHVLITLLRTWITEPGKEPLRPHGLLIFNLSDGAMMGVEIAEKLDPDWVREMVFKAFTRPAPGSKPHRPTTVTLADPELVATLSPALAEIGVTCQQMDTPEEACEIVAELEAHLREGRPQVPSLLSVQGVTPEIVRDLFVAADEFYRAAPWVHLTNRQGFAVQLAGQAAPRYVSVMGNAGMEYGLSVNMTWEDFEQMVSGALDHPKNALPKGGLHSLLFNSITEIPFDDLDALEKYHWPVANDQAYPMPIIFERPDLVLRPGRDELLWYQAALRVIPIFVRDNMRSDGRGDYAPAEASLNVPTSEGETTVIIRYPAGELDHATEAVTQIDWLDEDEGEGPFFDRRMMEGQMAAATGQMRGGSFYDDPKLQQAQELMYKAWEERNPGRRITLAHEALSISPNCADAYVLLAEEGADTIGRALEYYRQGVEAGERALGGKFEDLVGHFWAILETRPYMRARYGLAHTLWRLERREEARSHFEELLRLNPGDNQGIRYLLADLLLQMDLDADLSKLLGRYRSDWSAVWLYTGALVEFRRGGATPSDKANKALKRAFRQNMYVPPYLTGQKRIPHRQPEYIGLGDENEAIAYASDHLNHWRRTRGAVAWLQDQLDAFSSAQAAQRAAKGPTFDGVIESLLAEANGPVTLDELAPKVLARKPSKAQDPVKFVINHLRNSYGPRSYAFLDHNTVLPLRLVFQGVRFRIALDRQMVSEGALPLYPYFTPFLRDSHAAAPPKIMPTFQNEQGLEIPCDLTTLRVEQEGPVGEPNVRHVPALDLKTWLTSVHARRDDSLLLTVLDWETGLFQLALEPERRRRKAEVAQQNRAFADVLYDLLETTHDERLWTERGLQTAFARFPSARSYPGDHWTKVIEQDGRMTWLGFDIVHSESDHRSLWDKMQSEPGEEAVEEKPFTAQQGERVYRFRARRGNKEFVVEAQGINTLGDLDAAMRAAFRLDALDHLSEFTLITPRGKGKQPRRKPFGPLDPIGEYAAHRVRLAGLGLEPGAQLEYLYDFGDNVEHALVLEAVAEPEAKAKYPRFRRVKGGKRKT